MKRKLYLHGAIAGKFSDKPLHMNVDTYATMLDAFRFVYECWDREYAQIGPHAVVLKTGDKIDTLREKFLSMPFGEAEEVHIVPIPEGADPVTITAFMVGMDSITLAAAVGSIGIAAINILGGMAIAAIGGAIVQHLVPKPKSATSGDKNKSNLLTGAPNAIEEGGVVPVVFGLCKTSATLIDFGTYTEEAPITQ
jgi:predicted phage tail protein